MILYRKLFLLSLVAFLGACAIPKETTLNYNPTPGFSWGNQYSWLIMVYMDGDNDLESFALQDLNEMENVDLSDSDVKVLVLMDRAQGYSQESGDWTETRLYEVQYDSERSSEIVSRPLTVMREDLTIPNELNMGDPAVLRGFIQYCMNQYPSVHQSVILWNHGDGWRGQGSRGSSRAVCEDLQSSDKLYTQEVGTALEGLGIEVLGLDLCYGAMMEFAYEVRNDCTYIVASEEEEPQAGWNYELVLEKFISQGNEPTHLYTAIIDAYKEEYEMASRALTLSVISCAQLESLHSALNNFCAALGPLLNDQVNRDNLRTALVDNCQSFDSIPGDKNVDIGHMAVLSANLGLAIQESTALKNALDQTIPYQWVHDNYGSATGLAIHFAHLDGLGAAQAPVDSAYDRAYNGDYPLEFLNVSSWPPNSESSAGFLDLLWQ